MRCSSWCAPIWPRKRFRATIDTVQVNVTVTDANGRLITGLSRDDFEIFEDGTPQPITVFTDERVPISLGVLLDSSDSMRGQRIADARGAVDRFVSTLLEPGDEAFIAAFNHRPRLSVRGRSRLRCWREHSTSCFRLVPRRSTTRSWRRRRCSAAAHIRARRSS